MRESKGSLAVVSGGGKRDGEGEKEGKEGGGEFVVTMS